MEVNQKTIVASKNASKIITSILLAFIMCASVPLLCSSDDEREALNAVMSGLIDGGLGFDMMEQRSIDASFGFVSGEDSEEGVHSDVREVSCAPAEQFSRKRKRVEGDERRAKRALAPSRPTAAHVLSLPDLSGNLMPLQPFLLPDQDLDLALLLSLPLPCPDLSPVELQSDDQPLDGLFGTYEYGQDVADVPGVYVAVGVAGDKAVASEGVDVVRGKRKRGNAGGAIKVRDAEKPFECVHEGCGYAAAKASAVKLHMRTHTGEKPFECDFQGCTYATAQSEHLKTHMRTHTGEKPFTCDFQGCTYASTRKDSLEVHKRVHTSEKPFGCDFPGCTYATARKNSLEVHIKSKHTGEKPFKCGHDGCVYAATGVSDLAKHKRMHTGEKYACDAEGCEFISNFTSSLKRHKRIHSGEKAFECGHEGCDFRTACVGNLKKHKRGHAGEKS